MPKYSPSHFLIDSSFEDIVAAKYWISAVTAQPTFLGIPLIPLFAAAPQLLFYLADR